MLNLDTILAKPFEVKIGGVVYFIPDPGMEKVTQMISLSISVKDNPKLLDELLLLMKSMTAEIPEEIFNKLSSGQVIVLLKSIGEHFLSGKTEEGKQTGPLPDGA